MLEFVPIAHRCNAASAMGALQHAEHLAESPHEAACRVDHATRNDADKFPATFRVGSFQNVRDPHVIAKVLDGVYIRHEDILDGNWFADPHSKGFGTRSHFCCLPRLAPATIKFVALLRRYADSATGRNVACVHGIARTPHDPAQRHLRRSGWPGALGARCRARLVAAGIAAFASARPSEVVAS
jgi:hypothetical protein